MDRDRQLAYRILVNVMINGEYSNLAIKEALGKSPADSPNFVRRLVYGTIEKTINLDYYLDNFLSKGVSGTEDRLLVLLRMATYQMEFMDGIPDYAAIDSSVEIAKKHLKGRDKLVNGVLRNWQRRKKEIDLPSPQNAPDYFSVLYSCNKDIVKRLIEDFGEKRAEAILSAEPEGSRITLRVNLLKTTAEDLKKELKEDGLITSGSELSERMLVISEGDIDVTETRAFQEGRFSIQTEGSCWIADATKAKEGDRILDTCAAPGGKTMAMAEAMNNRGEIIAGDLHAHRLELIEKSARRLGIDIVNTIKLDASKDSPESLIEESFDIVLIDAPCSGLGMIGRKPEIKLRPPDIESLSKIQSEILYNSMKYVKPGGRLVYSTCTITKAENENIIKQVIEGGEFQLEREEMLTPDNNPRCDGFYLAVMRKKGDHPHGCGI